MLVLQYVGGLGNQLFEYAYYRALVESGKKIRLDYSFFVEKGWAYKINLFPNVKGIRKKNSRSRIYFYLCGMYRKFCRIFHKVYQENINDPFDRDALSVSSGLVTGYFQNYTYFENISNKIRTELQFPEGEKKLADYIKKVDKEIYVSIHVRRKDYLDLSEIYGGICNKEYYKNAVDYILKKETNVKFLIFSDDSEWVKKNMDIPNSTCFSSEDFNNYDDWYDMCLMSHCKHNIIANSSFSWWGAWLNNNPEKIVICPSRWDNLHPNREIACVGWIKM